MGYIINYTSQTIISIKQQFNGSTEDGRKFIIQAICNKINGWTVELIVWEDNDGTDVDNLEIENNFLKVADLLTKVK
jgi:hypothetical protein